MKAVRFIPLLALLLMTMPMTGQSKRSNKSMETNSIKLTIRGGETFTAMLVDNSSTRALKEQLAKGDITVEMEDYADMEKVGSLGISLPRNDRRTTTGPGDLILYQGHNLGRCDGDAVA